MDIVLSKFKNILNLARFEKLIEAINTVNCENDIKLKNLQSLYILLHQNYFKFNTCLKIFKKGCSKNNSDFLNKAYCYVVTKEVKQMLKEQQK